MIIYIFNKKIIFTFFYIVLQPVHKVAQQPSYMLWVEPCILKTGSPCYSDNWKHISVEVLYKIIHLFPSPLGQTDMPVEGLEATLKAITLMEDFTDFDTQLPDTKYFCFPFSLI